MRKNPAGWTAAQTTAMHWLQRSALKSARAWRLRMALREVYARVAWHGLSAMGLGLTCVLLWLSQPAARLASAGRVEWCVAMAMAATGLLVLVSNRGRHPAWVALLGVAGLVLMSR